MRTIFIFLLGVFLHVSGKSQTTFASFVSSTIPEELKKEANVVYRLDEGVLNVLSASEYTLQVHQVLTILNAEGASHLNHRLFSDKFNKVEEVEIKVYDAIGMLVRTFGKKDFDTEAAFDGISLVNDDKVMKLYTPAPAYPCTVDVRYKLRSTGYVELPNWFINYNEASTELFRYEVTVPAAMDIRHRTLNLDVSPKIETTGTTKHYTWEAKNISGRLIEKDGFEPARYLPQVEIAPNEFSYDGYKGSFRTWADFGAWNYQLYEEKQPFSETRVQEIKSLVAAAKSGEDTVRLLYQYLQQNMRYVSIQLGIGGFKPFAVKFVDEKRYGDCKALTNYMRYLLRMVGIKAYPALINAGNNKIPADPQFASDPFNHVVLCIPRGKDSTWLECTSNLVNAGELGPFTENRRALLLTEQGGVLVNTPRSDYRKNLVATRTLVSINSDGGADVENTISGSGEDFAFYRYISQLKTEDQKERLVGNLRYRNPDDLLLTAKDSGGRVCLLLKTIYDKLYDFTAGSKYFFPVCINRLATENLRAVNRRTDYLFSHPYEKSDTTVFQLPSGFSLESSPPDKNLQSDYSRYKRSSSYDKERNRLTVVRTLTLLQHVIPPGDYLKLARFFSEVTAADEENLVFVKH